MIDSYSNQGYRIRLFISVYIIACSVCLFLVHFQKDHYTKILKSALSSYFATLGKNIIFYFINKESKKIVILEKIILKHLKLLKVDKILCRLRKP